MTKRKYTYNTEELLKQIDKFQGDPPAKPSRKDKLKRVFKKITFSGSEEPEIMESRPVH
jgi:hypothetical protein